MAVVHGVSAKNLAKFQYTPKASYTHIMYCPTSPFPIFVWQTTEYPVRFKYSRLLIRTWNYMRLILSTEESNAKTTKTNVRYAIRTIVVHVVVPRTNKTWFETIWIPSGATTFRDSVKYVRLSRIVMYRFKLFARKSNITEWRKFGKLKETVLRTCTGTPPNWPGQERRRARPWSISRNSNWARSGPIKEKWRKRHKNLFVITDRKLGEVWKEPS